MSTLETRLLAELKKAAGKDLPVKALADQGRKVVQVPAAGLELGSIKALLHDACGLAGDLGDHLPGDLHTGKVTLQKLQITGLGRAAFALGTGRSSPDQPMLDAPLNQWSGSGSSRCLLDRGGRRLPTKILGDPDFQPTTRFAKALHLDGLGDAVELDHDWGQHLPKHQGLFRAQRFTVSLWVQPAAGATAVPIVEHLHYDNGVIDGWILAIERNGKISFGIRAGDKAHFGAAQQPLGGQAWVHVALVWDQTVAQLYIDGVAHGSANVRQDPSSNGRGHRLLLPSRPISLGRNRLEGRPRFKGQLAELKVFAAALGAEQIKLVGGVPPPPPRIGGPQVQAVVVWKGTTWDVVPGLLSLKDPGLGLCVGPHWLSGSLFTETRFAGSTFGLQAGFPDGRCELSQKRGDKLPLAKVLGEFGLDAQGWPSPELEGLDLIADPRGKRLALHAQLDDPVQIQGVFEVKQVSFDLFVEVAPKKSARGDVSATLQLQLGSHTIDVRLRGSHLSAASGWELAGGVAFQGGLDIPVGTLLDHLKDRFGASSLPSLPAGLSTVHLQTLHVVASTRQHFAFSMTTEKASLSVEARNVGGQWQLSADQRFTIGSAVFDVRQSDVGGVKTVSATWTESKGGAVHLLDVAKKAGLALPGSFPSALDLGLNALSVELRADSDGDTFMADGKLSGGETVFVIATKVQGTWQGAAGVAVKGGDLVSKLGEPGKLLDKAGVAPAHVVAMVSTLQARAFVMPPLPNFGKGGFPGLGAAALNLSPGLMLAAEVDLDNASSPIFKNLGSATKLSKVLAIVEITDPVAQSSVSVAVPGKLPVMQRFELDNVGVTMRFEPPEADLHGTLLLPIDHVTLDATGRFAISVDEAVGTFDVSASTATGKPTALPCPMGFRGVKLDEIGVESGLTFAPPGAFVGLEAKFQIGNEAPGANRAAIVLEIETASDPIPLPDPLLLSVFLETVSVETALIAVNGSAPSLPSFVNVVKLSNLWLYFCEEPLLLPDGTMAQPGFGFNGLLDVHGFVAHAGLIVSPSGIDGSAQLPPIRLGTTLSITGDKTPAIKLLEEQVNGQWVPVKAQGPVSKGAGGKYTSAAKTSNPTALREVIAAGGARFAVSTEHSPYLSASARLRLWDFEEDIHLEVTDHGFDLSLHMNVGSIGHMALDARLGRGRFSAHGHADIDVNHSFTVSILGLHHTVHLDTGLELSVELDLDSAKFHLGIDGHFWFDGFHLDIPHLTVTVEFAKLEDLAGVVLKHIEHHAADIFLDVFGDIGEDLKKAGEELKKLGEEAGKEAKALAKDVGKAAQAIEKKAEAAVQDIENETLAVAKDAEKVAEDLARTAERDWQMAEAAAKVIGAAAEKAAKAMVHAAEEAVKAIGKAAAAAVHAIGEAAKKAAEALNKAADEIFDGIKKAAEAAARLARKAWHALSHY